MCLIKSALQQNMFYKYAFFLLAFSNFLFTNLSYADDTQQTVAPTSEVNLQGQIARAEFISTRTNLGNIYRGQMISRNFYFKNTGDGTLLFNGVHASCGCINTSIFANDGVNEKNNFKPGESGFIRVTFDSSGFTGAIVRTVTVETNMGFGNPTTTLTLTANVQSEISTNNKDLLYVGKIQSDSQNTYNIRLNLLKRGDVNAEQNTPEFKNSLEKRIQNASLSNSEINDLMTDEGALKVISITANVPYLRTKILDTSQANSVDIQIQLDGSIHPIPIGPLNARIIVWNNSRYYKSHEIPVVGEVLGHVQVSAKYVEFGVVNSKSSARRMVSFSSNNKKFQITGVKVEIKRLPEMKNIKDSDFFDIKKEKMTDTSAITENNTQGYILYFKLQYPNKLLKENSTENVEAMNVSGTFLVKTNDPDYKEISLPFFGVVKKD